MSSALVTRGQQPTHFTTVSSLRKWSLKSVLLRCGCPLWVTADILGYVRHVHFTPESGHSMRRTAAHDPNRSGRHCAPTCPHSNPMGGLGTSAGAESNSPPYYSTNYLRIFERSLLRGVGKSRYRALQSVHRGRVTRMMRGGGDRGKWRKFLHRSLNRTPEVKRGRFGSGKPLSSIAITPQPTATHVSCCAR